MTEKHRYIAQFSWHQIMGLTKGQKIIDAQGCNWEIISGTRERGVNDLEFDVRRDGSPSPETLNWIGGYIYVFEKGELFIHIHLNHSSARIV